jgi:hypothetical protein
MAALWKIDATSKKVAGLAEVCPIDWFDPCQSNQKGIFVWAPTKALTPVNKIAARRS